jgi:hypothetical protein
MTKARLDGLYMLLLGSVVFLLLGAALARTFSVPMVDFRVLYYPARCLVQHCDPYNEGEVLQVVQAEKDARLLNSATIRNILTRYMYPPTVFSFTVPFALLPWGPAHILWMTLLICVIIFASFLIWDLGSDYLPTLSGFFVGFVLANSELLVITGNVAGIAISLCVVAVWCFFRGRYVWAGILCLAVGLVIKPHDTALIWLYFLLSDRANRKRALQTLFATVVVSLPAVLWVWHVSPHWLQELHSNILAFANHGDMNDPGLDSSGAHGIGMLVSLQAVIGIFWDDPRIYNPASYLIFAPLLLAWVIITLRSRFSPSGAWLGIAAIAALSMLPVYHRLQDTKLLLLTVPACAMLWARRGLAGWLALLVTASGFVLTGDLPWAVFLSLIHLLRLPTTGLTSELLIGLQVLSTPLILLAMGIFYLWVYARHSLRATTGSGTVEPSNETANSEETSL